MKSNYLTYDECLRRYPRLARCMQWCAVLSSGEAGCAIRDFRAGYSFSGEAVDHYGGPAKVIRDAIRNRHFVRSLSGGRYLP